MKNILDKFHRAYFDRKAPVLPKESEELEDA